MSSNRYAKPAVIFLLTAIFVVATWMALFEWFATPSFADSPPTVEVPDGMVEISCEPVTFGSDAQLLADHLGAMFERVSLRSAEADPAMTVGYEIWQDGKPTQDRSLAFFSSDQSQTVQQATYGLRPSEASSKRYQLSCSIKQGGVVKFEINLPEELSTGSARAMQRESSRLIEGANRLVPVAGFAWYPGQLPSSSDSLQERLASSSYAIVLLGAVGDQASSSDRDGE